MGEVSIRILQSQSVELTNRGSCRVRSNTSEIDETVYSLGLDDSVKTSVGMDSNCCLATRLLSAWQGS